MAVGILKYPMRRQALPYPASLYCPFSKMQLQNSPNLLSWNGASPSGDWSGTRSTLSDVATPTPPVSAKCLKVLCNDAGSAGASQANVGLALGSAKYQGLTATLSAWGYALSTNALQPAIRVGDDTGNGTAANITKDDAWHYVTASRRLINTSLYANLSAKIVATANTTDIAYFDAPSLTVPQIVDRTGKILHPDITSITGLGAYLDSVDDLITSETDVIGTGNITVCATIYLLGWGGGGLGRIFDNGTFIMAVNQGGTNFYLTSDNVSVANSGDIGLNTKCRIVGTRDTNGISNLYVNKVLSGTANQNSGTLTSGTKLLTIGNRLAGDRSFSGYIDDLIVYPRIFTLADVQQDYAMFGGR
jgi:hypothetical protein